MTDLILHHYATSPYSEKIRAIFGYKRMAWRSVQVPTIMPKPDLTALTGGYRRTPVLQIGCDIFCDTKLMAHVLDRLQPEPALLPPGLEAVCAITESWVEQTLFFLVLPVVMQPAGLAHFFSRLPPAALEAFQKDREALFTGAKGRRASMAATRNELPGALASLDATLAGLPYLTGPAPTLADFSVFHPVWFIVSNPGVAGELDPYPHLLAWTRRMAAFGHGEFEKLSSADALAVARASQPLPAPAGTLADLAGLPIGAQVSVRALDYGPEAVTGELAWCTVDELAVRRRDERAGELVVHFPRAGFRVDRA